MVQGTGTILGRSTGTVLTIGLLYSAIALCLCILHPDLSGIAMYPGAGIRNRMLYPFFHASLLHAIMNCWCLLSIVFIYKVSAWTLLEAYLIAVTYPSGLLSFLYPASQMTVGLSGVCYYLLGSLSFSVKRRVYWQVCICITLLAGFLFPRSVDCWLHLYCYIWGVIAACVNKLNEKPC